MTKRLIDMIIMALLCTLTPLVAFAQRTTSRVTGTVTDLGGAAVPGATVILTNAETTVAFNTTGVQNEARRVQFALKYNF